GRVSPVPALSSMFYVDASMPARSSLRLDPEHEERAAYAVQGKLEAEGQAFDAGTMLVFAPGEQVQLTVPVESGVALLGGAPVGKRHIWWNFVASTQGRLDQAKRDWQAGRFAPVPGDIECIPLPER